MTSRTEVAPARTVVTGGHLLAPIRSRRHRALLMLAASYATRRAFETGINHAVLADGLRVVSAPAVTAPRPGIDVVVAVVRPGHPRAVTLATINEAER